MRRQFLSATLSVVLAGCATASNAVPASNQEVVGPQERTGRTSDYIGDAEIRSASSGGANDAYDVITRLRPFFFRRGRETSPVDPGRSLLQVYLDNVKLGGLETLQTVPIDAIKSIQYLNSGEATLRWGTNHTGGVILLSTKQ
jgi:hypothetical protein